MSAWTRFRSHSLRAHLLAPVWRRISEKQRWAVVHWLNKSDRFCWCGLVDAALYADRDDDACDVPIPLPDSQDDRCKTVCDWSHPDHVGAHDCSCYCAKFRFVAPEGAIERTTR